MRLTSTILFVYFLLVKPAMAQDKQSAPEVAPNIKFGVFSEFSRDPVFQSNLVYSIVEVGDFKIQYDNYSNPAGYQRIWINPCKIQVVESDDFICKISPGFSVSNQVPGSQTDFLIGADVEYTLPGARIQILQRSYKGNHFDQHYVFSTWQPIANEDQFLIMHFMNINSEFPSTSYVGPAANIMDGKLFFWTGLSLTKNATWATNLELKVEF